MIFFSVCFPAGLSAAEVPGTGPDLTGAQAPAQAPTAKPEDLVKPGHEPANPAEPGNAGKPLEETPSGTKPAEPATPGENPAIPAEPDKGREEKDKKNRKNKPGKGGNPGALSQPAAALVPASGAAFGLLPGGGKEKKEVPEPASKETTVSSEPVKPAANPLYSSGKGPRIAVLDFEGEAGAEFAALLSKALSPDLKVYSRGALAARNYSGAAMTRVLAKKICAETGVDYLVTGRASKKTETLTIISVFLRDGKTGDTTLADYQNLKPGGDPARCAEAASGKILERLAALGR